MKPSAYSHDHTATNEAASIDSPPRIRTPDMRSPNVRRTLAHHITSPGTKSSTSRLIALGSVRHRPFLSQIGVKLKPLVTSL